MKYLPFFFVLIACAYTTLAQPPVAEWTLHPDYRLPGQAANYPGPRLELPKSGYGTVSTQSYPLLFKGEEPTQRIANFFPRDKMPEGPFSVEMWLVNHVNQPVGVLATIKSNDINEPPAWLLGYYGNQAVFSMHPEGQAFSRLMEGTIQRGFKKYWLHLVATYDGYTARLYFNGEELAAMDAGKREPLPEKAEIELAAYLKNEPYMELANLMKGFRLYDRALSREEVLENLNAYQNMVETGTIFPGIFHFTAGPYLHYSTPSSINISWETNRRVRKAIVQYGEKAPLSEKMAIEVPEDPEVNENNFIQMATLDGLKPSTPYFYNLLLTDEAGETIESGILTFATAPEEDVPFTFAVIGDTEARPHINFQVSKLIWEERPNFLLNLGDLTDGGMEHHKFEWPYEYFTGMTALASRIPVFPVAGNGEGDLFWYKRYHKLPGAKGYYSFRYGNAEFFMLDSNRKEEFAPGGEQYLWLEEQLQQSAARWKFVCHHHAPYSSDENDYGDSWKGPSALGDPEVRQIVPLYEKYGVDIVFFGHLHTYQRTLPVLENKVDKRNGVIYLQGGGGGGNLEDFTPTRSWFSAKTYRGHHYFTVSVEGGELHLRMFDTEGRMRDFLTVKK
ncbi:MAG: metallophosphoesterase [Phaeodactylibacter sp.]|nr:metallophosphoesterase [Phaeodactylibacter sp.]